MRISAPLVDERMDSGRPRSSQTTVSVNFDEADSASPLSRIQFGVAECVETRTVTTTTTTKRSYPPLLVRETRPLASLDSKEYPLAQKPTPPELANFTFNVGHFGGLSWPSDDDSENQQDSQLSTSDESTQDIKTEPGSDLSHVRIDRRSSKPYPQVSSRKPQRMGSRAASPIVSGSVKKNSQKSHARSFTPNLSLAVSDKLRRALTHSSRKESIKNSGANWPTTSFPVTPDTTDTALAGMNRPLKLRHAQLDSFEAPESDPSQPQSFFTASSPSGSDSHTAFGGSNVATPPITDADEDAEPFADVDADESLQQSIRALQPPRPINTLVSQDASLPSPRLSPTLQASKTHLLDQDEEHDATEEEVSLIFHDDSQNTMDYESVPPSVTETPSMTLRRLDPRPRRFRPTIMDTRSMLETFDSMPPEMKTFMMYQFLRRCSRKTLHVVADVVNPALKCDILKDLPLELTFHILSYLDHRDLCHAAQVSKHWRGIIDSNETGWKELFDNDGFVLAPGELDRAIREGWGWQDPVGPEGCERDYSLQNRLTSTETELIRSSKPDPPPQKLRSSKRKRALNSLGSERSKRRASAQETAKDEKTYTGEKVHKSEGPLSAANAAALAVPDPHVGLPSLRRLHLFKSLYRRHYMIRKSWTSGKVKPSHVAFAAHPRHVITCLQFDEDKIITGSDDMLIHVYDTKTGKLRRRLEGHEGGVWALQYEGNVLVSGSTDRSVRVWDIEKGLCTQVFYGHTSTVRCLQILMPTNTGKVEDGHPVMMPAKPLIITGSRDSQLRVWRLPESGSRRYIQTGPPANDADCPYFVRTLPGHTHSVRAIAAHADTLVSGSYDNTVRVWRISTGETVHILQGHSQKVYSVVLDVARNRCISGSMDSFVRIWDLETGSCIHTLEGHTLLVGLLDLRDERLVSAAADSTLRIWDPESGRCQSTLTAHTGAITCFQHDGRKVISGSDRTLKMWDIRSGECIQDLLTDLSGVWQVRFDERRCVAAVQRENLTYVEILDFGAVRDGKSPEELGKRILLNGPEVQRIMDEDN
ncbi:WD40 repeat-like protein [Durotheca rogersii]|uniref:WD40 repeat-like protein n=1 Tax=Durotheca rogersii TaxID=419775 RepID=UPI0022205C5B|nr:WD40 repeat-like protein [Durotheca rogersii]KAI5859261.1 WD40 repeat-like protein [Durotheca rogersii]